MGEDSWEVQNVTISPDLLPIHFNQFKLSLTLRQKIELDMIE